MTLERFTRFQAAAIHLAISGLVATATMGLMLAVWYPQPLFGAMGGKELILLIVGIDVAIGPLLTLIVFDTSKKELAFDLAVVATLQLVALSYGMYAMHSGRPVFVVFADGRFVVVSAAEVDDDSLSQAQSEFRTLPLNGPRVVAADSPSDVRQRVTLFFTGLAGMGVQNLPQYYVPYAERLAEVLAASRPLERLEDLTPEHEARLAHAVAGAPDRFRYLPLQTRYDELTALVDARTGEFLSIVSIRPPNS